MSLSKNQSAKTLIMEPYLEHANSPNKDTLLLRESPKDLILYGPLTKLIDNKEKDISYSRMF